MTKRRCHCEPKAWQSRWRKGGVIASRRRGNLGGGAFLEVASSLIAYLHIFMIYLVNRENIIGVKVKAK